MGKFKKYLASLILLFSCFAMNVNATSIIYLNGIDFYFTGSVWNGTRVIETYDSESNSPYLGYTSIPNSSNIKIYFNAGAVGSLNTDEFYPQNLTQKKYLYTMDVCSTFTIPSTYTTASGGDGVLLKAYDIQTIGSCSLSKTLSGTLYRVPLVIQFNNPSIGTITYSGNILVDVAPGVYYGNGGSYAVIDYNVSEYTEEVANQYNQIGQNNTIINQNQTIIGQNDQILNKQSEINSRIEYSNQLAVETNSKLNESNRLQSETNSKLDANKQAVDNQTNTMKDSNSSGATDSAGSFFSGFTTDTFGLTSIITAPLNLITSITSSTCAPVGLPIPFVESMTLNLPCLRGIYEQHFGTLLSVYQTITFGIVAYWVCIRIFALVKDFKNPEHDEIEVLDL